MQVLPTMSARHAVYVRDRLLDLGVQPLQVFQTVEFQLPDDPELHRPIPVSTFARLLNASADATGDPHFGLSIARHFHYELSGLLSLAFLAAPTVHAAIGVLQRYHRVVDGGMDLHIAPQAEQLRVEFQLLDTSEESLDQVIEYLVGLFIALLRTGCKQHLTADDVQFQHRRMGNIRTVEEFFRCPVQFGTEANTVILSRSLLEVRLATANPILFGIVSKAMQSLFQPDTRGGEMLGIVCREITRYPSLEHVSLEVVAQGLSMTARTLRRQLATEGHTFNDAKRAVRESRAKYLLRSSTMDMAQISFELGFSELSAFSRAFKKWTGVSPMEYRNQR